MGFFRFMGAMIAKPIVRPIQDIKKSSSNIKQSLEQLKEIAEKKEEKSFIYTPTDDAREGFEALYAHNKWTPEQLANQRKSMRRFKWAFLIMAWISVCGSIGVAFVTTDSPWLFLYGCVGMLTVALTFLVRAVQFALYQTQIDDRALCSLKAFWNRRDFWPRLFS